MKKIVIIALGLLMAIPTLAGNLSVRQQELKSQIIKVARENTNNTNNREEVRAQIDTLITELTRSLPPVTEQTWARYATGSWKQLWADERSNGSPNIGQDFDRIYQYVNALGQAVNIAERILPNGKRITFALKVRGVVRDNVQTTTILQGFSKDTPLLSGMSISYLSNDILSGRYAIFTPRALGEFPRGPINAESDLAFSYLDADLKVGTAPNVYTGTQEMFVLIKEDIVP